MKSNISSVLARVRENVDSDSNLSTELKTLGDPNCPHCSGAGFFDQYALISLRDDGNRV